MPTNFIYQISGKADKPLDVVIIGGSLAGLMHGIVVKRLGHNVKILEQYDSSTRESQAAGISAMEYSTAFLKKYDLLSDEPYAVSCSGVQFLYSNAHMKFQVARPLTMTSWNVLYYRFRANFDGMKSSYCLEPPGALLGEGKAVYETGKRVTNIQHSDGDLTVEFTDNSDGGTLKLDLVIAADGSTSSTRHLLLPNLKRTYAGYAIWRLESDVSDAARHLFESKTTIMSLDRSYIALYTIPAENGFLDPGKRLLNYVWYRNYAENSTELVAAMTDVTGKKHRHTLPIGKMNPEIWDKQKALATETLPAPFAELINKTTQPFITTVSDIASTQASFFNGKLLLLGDALVPFRPHVACSTNKAALDALLLEKLVTDEISLSQWETQVMDYAHLTRLRSITWGDWYQVGYLAFAVSKTRHLLAAMAQKLRSYWY